MKSRVYLETSVVSYLMALPSRDIVRAAHQQLTREWWAVREQFELFTSQIVLDEAMRGDPDAAARRLSALEEIALLDVTDQAQEIAARFLSGGVMPAKAAADASRSDCSRPRHGLSGDLELLSYRQRVDSR